AGTSYGYPNFIGLISVHEKNHRCRCAVLISDVKMHQSSAKLNLLNSLSINVVAGSKNLTIVPSPRAPPIWKSMPNAIDRVVNYSSAISISYVSVLGIIVNVNKLGNRQLYLWTRFHFRIWKRRAIVGKPIFIPNHR